MDLLARRRRFADVAGEWLDSNPGKAPASKARDRATLERHAYPVLGDRPISTLGPADLQLLVSGWAAAGLAPRTVIRNYGPVRATLLYAVNAGYLARSPVRGIKLPRVDAAPVRLLEPSELADLAGAMPAEYAPMVWLGAVLGLRWGEAAGVAVRAVDVMGRVLRVEQTVARDETGAPYLKVPKSAAGRRTLALSAPVAELLGAHMAAVGVTAADSDELLFPGPNGGPMRAGWFRSYVWIPACVTVGIGAAPAGVKGPYRGPRFHDLRRTSATALVVDGVDVKTAQYRLGHSSPVLTLAVYAQAVPAAERDAAARIGARLMPGAPWKRHGATGTGPADPASGL